MVAWEDRTELERAQLTLWDLHKEVTGFRPRYMNISSMTLEECNEEIEALLRQLPEE